MKSLPESPFITTASGRLRARISDWCRQKIGRALEALHSPAKIKEFEYVDPITNESVYLSTGTRYSVLHVGDKRYFFNRLTGRFDGTGTLFEERIVDRLQPVGAGSGALNHGIKHLRGWRVDRDNQMNNRCNKKIEKSESMWDEAIRDAEGKIKRLQLAIASFRAHRDAGIPWPETTSTQTHEPSTTSPRSR